MFDLLTNQLIRVDRRNGDRDVLSLPEVYEALMADDVTGFPALRPHQRHAWHAFLAQLGVVALLEFARDEPPRGAGQWHRLLARLTDDFPGNQPWCLIVDDPTKPAFLQCPALDGLVDFKKEKATPDDLDLLVTAKNHDVKSSVAAHGEVDDWLFALINVQTMGGFGGAGNYGIARMNGGYSSRPCVGLAPADGGPGAHLAHDIRRMVKGRNEVIRRFDDEFYFDPHQGRALLWLESWDGMSSLQLDELDPYFIEICRRIRLVWRDGRIVGLTATSKKPRIAAKHARGHVGDHWTPVAPDGKALSISPVAFRYDRLAKLVLDETAFVHPPAMAVDVAGGGSWRLVARGVASGQGKTEGYHERSDIVLGPAVARALMSSGTARVRLESLSKDQIAEIDAVARALRFAIAIAASGGKDGSDLGASDREKAYPYLRRFDATVDVHFFGALQKRFQASGDERPAVRREFARLLIDRASALLREAVEIVPCTGMNRYRARARATSAFRAMLWRSDVLDHDIFDNAKREEQHV